MPIAATTALRGIRDVGEVKAGQRVLVNGAGGGVGTGVGLFAPPHAGMATAAATASKRAPPARARLLSRLIRPPKTA